MVFQSQVEWDSVSNVSFLDVRVKSCGVRDQRRPFLYKGKERRLDERHSVRWYGREGRDAAAKRVLSRMEIVLSGHVPAYIVFGHSCLALAILCREGYFKGYRLRTLRMALSSTT